MNILDELNQEWESQGRPRTPFRSPREIEVEYNNNLMLAAKIQDDLGRPLSEREIFDLTM